MDVNEQQQLFKRYLNGTASPAEHRWVEAWYAAFDRVPDEGVAAAASDPTGADMMLQIENHIGCRKRIHSWARGTVAACALLALGLLVQHFAGWPMTERTTETVVTALRGERRPVRLSDSTVVWLNGESRLRYVSDYGRHDRKVWLEYGEAFFDVMPNTDKPFAVYTEELQVNVLGTAFNVDIDAAGDVVVGVRHGTVQVMRGSQQLGVLTRGDELQLLRGRMKHRLLQTDAGRIASWQLDKLELDNVGFDTLCQAVSDFYGISVRAVGAGKEPYRFTLTLDRGVPVYGTLEIIAAIHPIDYKEAIDGTITIFPKTL